MEWVLVVLVVIALVIVSRSVRSSGGGQRGLSGRPGSGRQRLSAADVEGVKKVADEDVTEFGAELQTLDNEVTGRQLDEGTRADYQRALDAYDDAKLSVGAIAAPDDVRNVASILGDGRYAVACVRARVAGEPLPARRAPCFFNPQHGPSVRDVSWSPDGGSPREVPACALDAQRIAAGAEPDSRTVMLGSRRVPYWQAGPAYAPWAAGYFGGFGLVEGLFIGTMMGSVFDGSGGDGSYDQGYDQGYDDGQDSGADGAGDGGSADGGGGWDGGGDSGGWDGGGGDFGGGDFGGSDF